MRLLAALYVAGILTLVGCWLIRKTDKYFWRGIVFGLIGVTAYVLFICSMIYLVWGRL